MKIVINSILVLFVICSACEKTISNIDLEKKDPKLVLHGFIGTEDEIVTNLTISKSSLSGDNILYIRNGFVDIFEDETLVHSLDHDTNGFFISPVNNLQPLKEYTIKAQAPNYPDVECNFTIPEKVEILSIDTTFRVSTETWEWGETHERKNYTFNIKFDDPAEEENYYIIGLYYNFLAYKYDEKTYEPVDSFYTRQYIYISSDDISAEFGLHDIGVDTKYDNEVYGSRGICLTDQLFSGKTKTFTLDVSYYEFSSGYEEPTVVYVFVQNISKDYYTFIKSYALYEDTRYDALAQNVNVYNNVDGGFGIIGAFSLTTDSVTIPYK